MSLPWCPYPTAADTHLHGFQPLPKILPLVNLAAAQPFRSPSFRPVPIDPLASALKLQLARVMAHSFARREPMLRFLQLPTAPPEPFDFHVHNDPLGSHMFGPWTTGNLFSWLIRLYFLTDPTSPHGAVALRDDVHAQSLAILDANNRIIGGAINETFGPPLNEPLRDFDPILAAISHAFDPIFNFLGPQEHAGIEYLAAHDPAFQDAYENALVGHHVLIARSDELPTTAAFELVAGTVEHYTQLGFHYIITSAVNQWTGAAVNALGGVPLHFDAFLLKPRLAASPVPIAEPSTPTGFLSNKDSGSMLYVLRLR